MEIWKTIEGFSRYEASNLGRLRSLNYKRTGKTKVLKPADSGGYLKTMLQKDSGKYKSWNVHKFVALAWFGSSKKGIEVNHKNGIKHDNSVENLEYCTRSENLKHAYENNLLKTKRGSLNGMSKLTESQVKEIREIAKDRGARYDRKGLGKQFGVSAHCIKDVVTRRRNAWQHV